MNLIISLFVFKIVEILNFKAMINNNRNLFYQDSEHYLQRVLAGNADDVRRRLTLALERLD